MFAGTAHDALATTSMTPEVKTFLLAHVEPMVTCYQKWWIYSCTDGATWSDRNGNNAPSIPATWDGTTCECVEPTSGSGFGRALDEQRALHAEEMARRGRELTHASMPPECANAAVGGGAGTGVEALGCFLWTIYGHYPFQDREFQEAFDLFGFRSVQKTAVEAMATSERATLTSAMAGAFMQSSNAITASSAAVAAWNQPMTVATSRSARASPRRPRPRRRFHPAAPSASSPAITLPTATATTAASAPSTRSARAAPTAPTAGRVHSRGRRLRVRRGRRGGGSSGASVGRWRRRCGSPIPMAGEYTCFGTQSTSYYT